MKNIILMATIGVCLSCFGVVYTPEEVAEFRSSLNNLPENAPEITRAGYALKIAIGEATDENIAEFSDLLNICKTACSPFNKIDKDRIAIRWACLEVSNKHFPQFYRDAFETAKVNDSYAYYYLAKNFKEKLEISDENFARILANHLIAMKEGENSVFVYNLTNQFIKQSIALDETETKNYLKQLNRVYTPLLLKNKAKWEPTIALIRTALETYK